MEILRIDLSHCEMEKIVSILNAAKKLMAGRPLHSVFTLTNVSQAWHTPALNRTMKEFVLHNKPFVCAGVVMGVEGIRKPVFEAALQFSGRALHLADNEEDENEWLLQQKS
jgi:hypothetical protein